MFGLLLITLAQLVAGLEERKCCRVFRHHHIANMLGQTADEQSTVEALVDDIVDQHHDVGHLVMQAEVDELEVVFGIQHIEVFDDLLVSDIPLTEGGGLVEDAQGIAHSAIGFLCDDVQGSLFVLETLFLGYTFEVVDGVTNRHAFEVIDLTTTEDGWQYLVLLCCRQDEDDMSRRLFQRFEERVERGG